MSSNDTNTVSTIRRSLTWFGFFVAFWWFLQFALYQNQVPYWFIAVMALAPALSGLAFDLLSPAQKLSISNATFLDITRLRQALFIAIGIASENSMRNYYRHHGEISSTSWVPNIVCSLIFGFIGGYGPIKLTRALGELRRNKASVQQA